MNRRYSSGVQNPITRSTPARLYQDRSIRTISPRVGSSCMYRWKYHCPRSVSLGAASATIRAIRGFRYSPTRLIAEPLPAASRPSKITSSRTPSARIHSCMTTSSAWSRYNSCS